MALADGTFYYPTDELYDRPDNYGLRYEDVFFPTTDGITLHGWFFPAPAAIGTVVHCHGNAGNVSAHFGFVAWLPRCGWNVLCFDYRGFGRSGGKPFRQGTIDDAVAAFRYAAGRDDVDEHALCVFGQSIGGAVGIVAVARHGSGVAGICVEGTFASYRSEARYVTDRTWYLRGASRFMMRYLISDELSPIQYVGRLPAVPKLFVCGAQDPIVDPNETIRLHQAASTPKELWIIDNSGHTEAVTGAIEGGREKVLAFFASCLRRQRG